MFPKIFSEQIFRRRNETELTVDSVFLKCANDAVFAEKKQNLQQSQG